MSPTNTLEIDTMEVRGAQYHLEALCAILNKHWVDFAPGPASQAATNFENQLQQLLGQLRTHCELLTEITSSSCTVLHSSIG